MKKPFEIAPRYWVVLAVLVAALLSVPVGSGLAQTATETPGSSPIETPGESPIETVIPTGPSPTPTATSTPTATATATPSPTATTGPTATATPVPPATAVPGAILGYHTVQPGETLYCIGRAYGVDPYAIATRNGIINPSGLRVGQVLAIPNAPRLLPPGPVCARQFGGATPAPATCRWHHTVVWGENLYRISLRYGVSMWAIAEANHIFNLHYIRAGQVLCIP